MQPRVSGLALLSVIGIGVAVTSCGSAPATVKPLGAATGLASAAAAASHAASLVASSAPGSAPAGYTRVGSATQGISLDVPASWVAFDLAKESVQAAAQKLDQSGVSAPTLAQDLGLLQNHHGVAVFDVSSAASNPRHFARSLYAYCFSQAGIDAGAAGVPVLKASVAQGFEKLGATHIAQQVLTIGGVPGVETSFQLSSPAWGTVYSSQLWAMPKRDDVCVVAESFFAGASAGKVLSVAAATAEFPREVAAVRPHGAPPGP